MQRNLRQMAAAIVGFLACIQVAAAHDFWIEKQESAYVLQYGHRGGARLPIERGKVKYIRCYRGKESSDLLSEAQFETNAVRFPAECDRVSVFYHGGFYSVTPDGEVNLPKNKVVQAVKSWESREFAKFLQLSSSSPQALTDDELEILLVTDPREVKPGKKITVRVLEAGKPVKDATVAIDERPIGETDSAGETRLRIQSAGYQAISATLKRKVSSPEADSRVLQASLYFEVPK